MKKVTHLFIGITIGVAIAYFTRITTIYLPIIGGFFGILPDFDVFVNKLGFSKHRAAYSHSLGSSIAQAMICFCVIYIVLGWDNILMFWLSVVAFCASFMHTVADSLTRGGTKLFYPISDNKYNGRIKYDDWLINGLLILLCTILIAFFGWNYIQKWI